MPRRLLTVNPKARVYEVIDNLGKVVGRDVEFLDGELSTDEKLARLEARVAALESRASGRPT